MLDSGLCHSIPVFPVLYERIRCELLLIVNAG